MWGDTRIRLAGLALLLSTGAALADGPQVEGHWFLELDRGDEVYVELRIDRKSGHDTNSFRTEIGMIDGLTRDQILAHDQRAVFTFPAQAGAIRCEGMFRNGSGTGTFAFSADPVFIEAMAERSYRSIRPREALTMAIHDITIEFVDEVLGLGYDPDLETLVAMGIHGVSPQYIRDMGHLGFASPSLQTLISMRIQGVTRAFVENMRKRGLETDDPEEYVAFRIQGVDAEYVDAMRQHFGDDLTVDQILAMRIHGVDEEFTVKMRELGFRNLDADDVVAFRIHNVTPRFIAEMSELGYDRLRADQAIAMRIHGVDADFVITLREIGYDDLTVDDLVQLKIHGAGRKNKGRR